MTRQHHTMCARNDNFCDCGAALTDLVEALKARAHRAATQAALRSLFAPYSLGVDHVLERLSESDVACEAERAAVQSVAPMVREFLQGTMSATASEGVLALARAAQDGDYLGDCLDDLVEILVAAKGTTSAADVGRWAEDYVKFSCPDRECQDARAVAAAELFATRMAALAEGLERAVAQDKVKGLEGVLIVDGMQPIAAVQVVERCGGRVYFAREAESGSAVLDVHMDTPTADAVALALYDYPIRYVPLWSAA